MERSQCLDSSRVHSYAAPAIGEAVSTSLACFPVAIIKRASISPVPSNKPSSKWILTAHIRDWASESLFKA